MLKVRESKSPHTTILKLSGSFDHPLQQELKPLLWVHRNWDTNISSWFANVIGIDSIVLGELFMWYHKMQPHHVKLSIVNPKPRIRKILDETRMSELLPFESSDVQVVNQNGTP